MTSVWIPIWRSSPLETGSLGAGLLIEPGVTAIARKCESQGVSLRIVIEGKDLDKVPTTITKLLKILEARTPDATGVIEVYSPLPLSVGYAVSAGLALGVSISYSLLSPARRISLEEAARIAHIAEVEAGTGLGDVIAEYSGRMLEVRLSPGAPGIGRLESYPVDADTVITLVTSQMTTSYMHEKYLDRIYREAGKAYSSIAENPQLDTLLEKGREFSKSIGFCNAKVASLLDELVQKGLARGWYAKKGVILVVPEDDKVSDMVSRIQEARIATKIFIHRVAGSPLGVERIA